jgi:tyrosinase
MMSSSRRALLVLIATALGILWLPSLAQAQSVQIEIGNTPDVSDDYLCWAPVPSRARLAASGPADVEVTLVSNRGTATGGAVQFQGSTGVPITPANFAPVDQLSLTLPKNGDWVAFHVAGKTPSVGQKDIKLQALAKGTSTVLGEASVMVRVRKNANRLAATERDQFLDALRRVRDKPGVTGPSRWTDYYTVHALAFEFGIHGGRFQLPSNFLPWHRAFLLNLERELQAFHPTVAIPYWKFDERAENLFAPEFIGSVGSEGTAGLVPPASVEVEFSVTNPLTAPADRWIMEGENMVRGADWKTSQPVSPNALPILLCEFPGAPCPIGSDLLRNITNPIEQSYHNGAHGFTAGWIGQGFSPVDPLFFLLHANTDRAWAHWQVKHGRFVNTGAHEPSYWPPNQYPPGDANRLREGLYALDSMWPWSGKKGNAGTPADPRDDWPDIEYAFPAVSGRPLGPTDRPTPAKVIDYLGVNKPELALGACYDDLGFKGKL